MFSRLLIFFIIGITPGFLWAGWHSQSIDTGGEVSVFSFSIGADNLPHISWYREGSIYFGEFKKGNALTIIIDSGTWLRDGDLKLTSGKDLQPSIVYCDENAKHLIHARRTNTLWTKSIITRQGTGRSLPPCAFISATTHKSEIPEIVFKDENTGTLKYARFIPQKWSISDIDTGGQMTFPTITVSQDEKPLVAYYDITAKRLKFARLTDTTWSTGTIDTGDIGKSIAVGFTSEHTPKVCYFSVKEDSTLKFAQWSGKAWRSLHPKCATLTKGNSWEKSPLHLQETVILGGTIALDKKGMPHVAYLNQSKNIIYAQKTQSGWKNDVIAHTDTYSIPQLLFDQNDLPRILFTDNVGLKYIYFTR